jgi:hypothetical protein
VIHLQLGEPLERRFPSPFCANSGAPPNSNRDGNRNTHQRDDWHGWEPLKIQASVFFESPRLDSLIRHGKKRAVRPLARFVIT